MPSFTWLPSRLERNVAPEKLPPDAARVMQCVDPTYQPGRVRRADGMMRTQVMPVTRSASSTAVTSVAIFMRRDCTRELVYTDTAGTVRLTAGDGTLDCAGPLNDWTGGVSPGS